MVGLIRRCASLVVNWRSSCSSLPGLPLQDSFGRQTLFCHDFMLDGHWFQNVLFLSDKMHHVIQVLCCTASVVKQSRFSQCSVDVIPSSQFLLNGFLLVKPHTVVEKKKIISFFTDKSLIFYFLNSCNWPCWHANPQGRFQLLSCSK